VDAVVVFVRDVVLLAKVAQRRPAVLEVAALVVPHADALVVAAGGDEVRLVAVRHRVHPLLVLGERLEHALALHVPQLRRLVGRPGEEELA
jgi:hypothetical protein